MSFNYKYLEVAFAVAISSLKNYKILNIVQLLHRLFTLNYMLLKYAMIQ